MISIGKIKDTERKILIDMYRLAKELSNKETPRLYELGHYLTDNLISKICMIIAIENNRTFIKKTYDGKEKSLSFYKLYNNILKEIYPDVPDYGKIKSLHRERNIYQHEYSSITHHPNKQYALDYIEKAKEIMVATGIIDIKDEIKATKYFRKNDKDEVIKNKQEIHVKCLNSLRDICSYIYGISVGRTDLDSSIVISSLNLLKTHKNLILPLDITYLEESIKESNEGLFSFREGVKIFIRVNCQKSLEIVLNRFQFKVGKIQKFNIDGREVQNFEDISQILECLHSKIIKNTSLIL